MIVRNGWRLLATLIFVLVPALTYGQDATIAHIDTPSHSAAPASEGVGGTSSPISPLRYPVVQGTALSAQTVLASGIIFSGHVTSVWRAPAQGGGISAPTAVTFQVEEGIRGSSTGQVLTIREWAGLWDRGERYRIGENVFLFLYPPSKLGLTSPVGGGAGRFEVDTRRRIVMNARNYSIFAVDPAIGGNTVVPYPDFERAVLRNLGAK